MKATLYKKGSIRHAMEQAFQLLQMMYEITNKEFYEPIRQK